MDQVAIVRQNFDAFQARDFDAVLKHVDEGWRYLPGPYVSSPGVRYQGHEGYRTMLEAGGWR
ncbi:MAG TPA: nuclear transport factor 2 family protein, partial [Solirubrobacterales bacterium]|nr:nuclear transport factor 2 family protein [Solirubrobacterales bacterium]